jgi:high-affinity nickel-transport protein
MSLEALTLPLLAAAADAPAPTALLTTAFLLGIRHGIDWDHIAAITDITSTTSAADVAEEAHELDHRAGRHSHGHGGPDEARTHGAPPVGSGPGAMLAEAVAEPELARSRFLRDQRRAILLGTLYALGHGLVVGVLGVGALLFGAILPGWVDPIMGRVVGLTLIVLGVWVFVSLYQYARYGQEFRLRSRWMLVFDGLRYAWRRLQARLHGHEHVDPLEMSSYGARTAFAVGMIHGVGAETATQALFIASIGGAAALGLGVPMLLAFIGGLLLSNTAIIVLSATGFVAGQLRQRLYLALGFVAGAFSLVVGALFLLQVEAVLPDLGSILSFIGSDG